MKSKKKIKKLNFPYPKKQYASGILEFQVINPTNEIEKAGEKLELSMFGEYCPAKSARGYNLLFLLDHPDHYRVSKVLMRGVKYVIPADRDKNWLPKTHPEHHKFVVK